MGGARQAGLAAWALRLRSGRGVRPTTSYGSGIVEEKGVVRRGVLPNEPNDSCFLRPLFSVDGQMVRRMDVFLRVDGNEAKSGRKLSVSAFTVSFGGKVFF